MTSLSYIDAIVCILVSLCVTSSVATPGPPYTLDCVYQQDCPAGFTCFKDYIGCNVGQCACTYGTRHDGSCILKPAGGKCTSHDECAKGTRCLEGRCMCPGEMIDEDTYCLKDHERLLGDRCTPNTICMHKKEASWEYVRDESMCAGALCQCRPGLIQDGRICRRIRPNEAGCRTNADCSGDSVCRDSSCSCPDGHRVVTNHKCGKNTARTNVKETYACDEMIIKDRFCAEGLQCVLCGSDNNYRCRRYRSSRPPTASSASATLAPLWTILVASSISAMLLWIPS